MPAPWKSWTKSLSCKSQKEENVHSPVSISAVSTSRSSAGSCSKSLSNLKDVIHGTTARGPQKSGAQRQQQERGRHHTLALMSDSKVWCSSSEIRLAKQQEQLKVHKQEQQQQQQQAKQRSSRFGGGCHGCNVADEAFGAIIFHRDSRSLCRFPHPTCQRCGESFSKFEALEHHHVSKHAVTELGRGDSSKNIVEIIFRTSWLKKEGGAGVKIERILKINNTQRTLSRFEEYRDVVKLRASGLQKKHARCIADGNELLRFHASGLKCDLGSSNSSATCSSSTCSACRIIKSGFSSRRSMISSSSGLIHTTATSGRAHYSLSPESSSSSGELGEDEDEQQQQQQLHAMLVCRVIAGRMHKGFPADYQEGICGIPGGYDSIAGESGPYSNVDDLYVQSSRAVLPCFVVIYRSK